MRIRLVNGTSIIRIPVQDVNIIRLEMLDAETRKMAEGPYYWFLYGTYSIGSTHVTFNLKEGRGYYDKLESIQPVILTISSLLYRCHKHRFDVADESDDFEGFRIINVVF